MTTRNRFRPTLEKLEERWAPALIDGVQLDHQHGTVEIHGNTMPGASVTLGAIAPGWTTADAEGDWALETDVDTLGVLEVRAVLGLDSEFQQADLVPLNHPPAAFIKSATYQASEYGLKLKVACSDPDGWYQKVIVEFGGRAHAEVGYDESTTWGWEILFDADSMWPDGGNDITITPRDVFDVTGTPVTYTIVNSAPVVSSLNAQIAGNWMNIYGGVEDEIRGGLKLYLNGPGADNIFQVIQPDGTFSIPLEYPGPGQVYTARVTDWFGLISQDRTVTTT